MGKTTQPLSGQAQRKFFRTMFQYDAGVTPEACERLTEACAAEIALIRVRLPLIVRRGPKPGAKADGGSPGAAPSKPAAGAADPGAKASAPPSSEPRISLVSPVSPGPAVQASSTPACDPHAFSLIVVMRKAGASALADRLSRITETAHLSAIASAQHVSLDPALTDRAEIIAAIVEGTGRRIAHRQAAAS